MHLKEMKRIAEKEILRYRESAAFVRGWIDGGGQGDPARFRERARWVWAVERVREAIHRRSPEKEGFFSRLYELDRPHGKRSIPASIVKLSMELYTSESTLYRWRDELLLSVAIAAVQARALQPFPLEASDGAERV